MVKLLFVISSSRSRRCFYFVSGVDFSATFSLVGVEINGILDIL